MLLFVEAIIIYSLLFLSGVRFPVMNSGLASPVIEFSLNNEISKLVLRNIPALALVFYILLTSGAAIPRLKIKLRDLGWAFIGLSGLAIIASLLGFIMNSQNQAAFEYKTPANLLAWFVLVLSLISVAYLEEAYFRLYLFYRLDISLKSIFFLSVLFFGLSHLYEGLWGFLNAILAGAFLSVLFLKTKSFHGIAWAHGLYNILVYMYAYITHGPGN